MHYPGGVGVAVGSGVWVGVGVRVMAGKLTGPIKAYFAADEVSFCVFLGMVTSMLFTPFWLAPDALATAWAKSTT